MNDVAALSARVNHLENDIKSGFERIENLLQKEISDLKSEQLSDLRKANDRLADDQRRLWDRVGDIERRENRRVGEHGGQSRVLSAIGHFISAACGGAITWLATWFAGGGSHH